MPRNNPQQPTPTRVEEGQFIAHAPFWVNEGAAATTATAPQVTFTWDPAEIQRMVAAATTEVRQTEVRQVAQQRIQQQIEPFPPTPEVLGAAEDIATWDEEEPDDEDEEEEIPRPWEAIPDTVSTQQEHELEMAEAKTKGFNNAIESYNYNGCIPSLVPKTDEEIYPARYAQTERGQEIRMATIQGYRMGEAAIKKGTEKTKTKSKLNLP